MKLLDLVKKIYCVLICQDGSQRNEIRCKSFLLYKMHENFDADREVCRKIIFFREGIAA